MNWDWDKLQEKRQRQSGGQPIKKPHHDEERQEEPRGSGGGTPPGFNQVGEAMRRFRGGSSRAWKFLILGAVVVWLLSGIFIVDPDEVGVITRFGAYSRTVPPGPHYHLPYPIEAAVTPKVTHVQRVEIGFRSVRGAAGQSAIRPVQEEASMLTGDENIVSVQFIVQYQIKDPVAFLFNVDLQFPKGPTNQDFYSESVKNAAEAAMREVIGGSKIDAALTDGKTQIQTEARDLLQQILDRYTAGISIQAVQMQDVYPPREVSDAFKDVASAREDRSRAINEAEAYQNEIIPRTRGLAAELINQAEAYKATVVQNAQGDAQRFLAVLTEYNKAKDITKKRLYLEAMEEVLSSPGMEKIIMDSEAGGKVIPYLPLDRLPGRTGNAGGK